MLTLAGDIDNEKALAEISRVRDGVPEGESWDTIVDFTRLTGSMSWDVVPRLAGLWRDCREHRPDGAAIVLVSPDPEFKPLARAVAVQFPWRSVYGVSTMADAHALLDAPERPAPL